MFKIFPTSNLRSEVVLFRSRMWIHFLAHFGSYLWFHCDLTTRAIHFQFSVSGWNGRTVGATAFSPYIPSEILALEKADRIMYVFICSFLLARHDGIKITLVPFIVLVISFGLQHRTLPFDRQDRRFSTHSIHWTHVVLVHVKKVV